MPHATAVIFDLGGVLLHWDPAAIVAGVFADPEVRSTIRREVFDHHDWVELDRGTLTDEEAVQRFAARTAQPPARLRELLEYVRAYLSPQPQAVALLEELHNRGVPLYCLSNMHARTVTYLQERYAFLSWFRGAVYSALVHMVKPEPGIYQYLLRQHGLDPGRSVLVDDAPQNVEAAQRLGLHGVLYTSVDACRRQLAPLLAPAAAG